MKVKNKKVKKTRVIDIIKDNFVKLKEDTAEFIDEHYVAAATVAGGALVGTLIYTVKICNLGINMANKNIIHVYRDGDIGTGDGIFFNHKIGIEEWVEYLEMLYSKTGKKKESKLEWLKEKGYID